MLSIQNYGQMNQMSNFKAKKLPNAQRTLRSLYNERTNYVQKEYPKIIAELQRKFEAGKISFTEYMQQMDKHFAKLTECVRHIGK